MTNGKALTATNPNLNGKDKTASTPAANTTTQPAADSKEVKPVNPPTAEKKDSALLPPIEARLQKLLDLQELVERRETIVEAMANLKEFFISPSGSCNLKLTDSKGKNFGIAHPAVIGEMVSMAKDKLAAELTAIEEKINFNF